MTRPTAPPRRGIDEDWDKVPPPALKAAGMSFVIGYLSEDTTGKNITKEQIEDCLRNGLDVVLVYEYGTAQPLKGIAQGVTDAQNMCRWATEVGAPPGTALYVALDQQFTASQFDIVRAYVHAWSAVCQERGYRSGAYADYDMIRYLLDYHATDFGWQTYAWSGLKWDARAVIRQTQNGTHVAGHVVDLDLAYGMDFGQWRSNGGVLMTISDDDWRQLHTEVRNIEGLVTSLVRGVDRPQTDDNMTGATFQAETNTIASALAGINRQAQSNGSSLTIVMGQLGKLVDAATAGGIGDAADALTTLSRIADALDRMVQLAEEEHTTPNTPATAPSVPQQAAPVDTLP